MTQIVRDGMLSEDINDEEIAKLADKIKALEKQIVNVIED